MIAYTVESGGPCQHCRRPIIRCHPTAEWIHTCLRAGCRDDLDQLTGFAATPASKVIPRNTWRWVS